MGIFFTMAFVVLNQLAAESSDELAQLSHFHPGFPTELFAIIDGEDRQGQANGYKPKTVKTRVGMRREAAEDIRTIFNPPDRETARVYLNKAAAKQAPMAPKLTDWMEANLPEGFTVFSFPKVHQRRLRTSNGLERLSQEIKR